VAHTTLMFKHLLLSPAFNALTIHLEFLVVKEDAFHVELMQQQLKDKQSVLVVELIECFPK
jgi:hypothetical protein